MEEENQASYSIESDARAGWWVDCPLKCVGDVGLLYKWVKMR